MTNQKFYHLLTFVALLAVATLTALTLPHHCLGQQPPTNDGQPKAQQTLSPAPSTGFRPLGTPSSVDRFKPPKVVASRPQSDPYPNELTPLQPSESSVTLLGVNQATSFGKASSNVTPTGFAQDQFVMPNTGMGGDVAAPVTGQAAPPVTRPSAGPAAAPRQPNSVPNRDPASLTRGASPTMTPLPQNPMNQPGLTQTLPPSPSDLAPVPTPQMNTQWSNAANSPLVTGPSGYRAVFWDCSAPNVVQTSGPYVYAPPTVMPNTPQAVALTANYPGYRPLFTLGQENYNVRLGQGIVGQPTVYVPGQPVRNFFRYLSP
jgi:hypothetical protein